MRVTSEHEKEALMSGEATRDPADLAWNLFTELRKELLESQKIRAQVTGFKITFVTTVLAVIATNADKLASFSAVLLTVPAFSAIFFDYLIVSYSFSIKRIGVYCELYLEPLLRERYGMPENIVMWQDFLKHPATRQNFSILSNLGITLLAATAGAVGILVPYKEPQSPILLVLLIIFLALDFVFYLEPRKFRRMSRFGPATPGDTIAGQAEPGSSSEARPDE